VGSLQILGEITRFCRAVYYSAHGPIEGERRFKALPLQDAVALWHEGLPHSRNAPVISNTVH